jgi:hypothetical protein
MKARNLTVTTSGRSSAPIRTDRGGGQVTVDGGSYTSCGLGSPVIYSTADVTVSDAMLTSNLSEGVCIEGKNSITLNNCQMTVSNTQRNGHAQFLDAIMIYQSFSGDADSGNSHFTMNSGRLTNRCGHLFHVTNTNAIITLNGVTLENEDAERVLLSVCADGWQGAKNKATLNASHQQLEGTILVGSDSELTLTQPSSPASSVSLLPQALCPTRHLITIAFFLISFCYRIQQSLTSFLHITPSGLEVPRVPRVGHVAWSVCIVHEHHDFPVRVATTDAVHVADVP